MALSNVIDSFIGFFRDVNSICSTKSLFSFKTYLFENEILMMLLIGFALELVIGEFFIVIMVSWQVFPAHRLSIGIVITDLVVSRDGLVI